MAAPAIAHQICDPAVVLPPANDDIAAASPLPFGAVKVGTSPPPKSLTLTNSGTGPLIGSVRTLPAPFLVTSGAGDFNLAPRASITVNVTFAGLSSAGLYQVNVQLPPTLSGGDAAVVAQVGTGKSQASVFIAVQQQ